MTASPQPGNQDERDAEVVRQWMRPDSQVPEGHCPATGCWYTLPLVDGLVVQHSRSGTLNTCLGGGRPPYDPAAAGETGAGEEADDARFDVGSFKATLTVTQLAPGHWERYRVNEHTVDWRYIVDQPEPAPSAGQGTDDRRCGRCGQIPYVHGLPDSTCVYEPTEAAGQDTGQMQDEIAAATATIEFSRQTHVEWATHLRANPEASAGAVGDATYHEQAVREYDNVLAVLRARRACGLGKCPHYVAAIRATVVAGDVRVAGLIAERDDLRRELDQARGQVQRVTEAIDRHADNLSATQRAAFRRALDGET